VGAWAEDGMSTAARGAPRSPRSKDPWYNLMPLIVLYRKAQLRVVGGIVRGMTGAALNLTA
jgi:hypothetical protein